MNQIAGVRVLLVRHAESTHGREGRLIGKTDAELSDAGREQANQLASRTIGVPIDAIYSSPLTRCVSTAQRIADAVRADVRPTADLAECDYGDWEGLTPAEIRERWPDHLAEWRVDEAVPPPGGESWLALARRVERWWDGVTRGDASRTVVAVTHGGPIMCIARSALGVSFESMHSFKVDPASISVLEVSSNAVRVRAWNDTTHIIDPLRDGKVRAGAGVMDQILGR